MNPVVVVAVAAAAVVVTAFIGLIRAHHTVGSINKRKSNNDNNNVTVSLYVSHETYKSKRQEKGKSKRRNVEERDGGCTTWIH